MYVTVCVLLRADNACCPCINDGVRDEGEEEKQATTHQKNGKTDATEKTADGWLCVSVFEPLSV